MPDVPSWWETVLLALASFRVWKLLAEDEILDGLRDRALKLGDWRSRGARPADLPDEYRSKLGDFLGCPWCAGAWIAGAWWIAWLVGEDWATMIAVPLALSTAVGLVRQNLDSE